jgi:hypothetical protein
MQRERWLKSRTRPARSWALRLGWDLPLGLLEERVAPAVVRGAASAQPALPHILAPTDSVAASLRPDVGPDYYAIAIPAAGRWTVRAAPAVGSALDPALTLYGPDGQQLIDAHDAGPGDRAAALDLHLRPGTYLLRVAAQDAAAGAYQLQSRFDPAAPPFDAFPIEHAKTLLRTIFTYGRRSDLQDLNGDGRPDLVTLGDRTASVRLGLGDGTFQSAPVFSHQAESLLIDFTLADVDGDRRLDLVLTANDGFVRLLSGTGNGSFQFVRDFAFGFGVNSAAVGDMNGDGRADLVTANDSTNSIAITLADGRGGFLEPRTFAAGVGADNVRLADFNGDGRLDAVVANWLNRLVNDEGPGDPYGASVGVLLGNGDGTLGPMQAYDIVDAITVAVADFNRDGRPDLAVAGFNEAVMVLLGNGDGTFQRGATVVLGGSPSIVAARDVNGDGRADVVAVNDQSDAGSLDVLLGNGDGTFRVRRVPKTKFEF